MSDEKAKILKRQLKKYKLSDEECPTSLGEWQEFLSAVSKAYEQYEEGRYLLERSLEISGREMSDKIEKNKELTLQLIQASKLSSLGTLSSGIAHELNNPLAGLMGHLELMKLGGDTPEKTIDRVERCLRLIKRMTSIVSHLRRLSYGAKGEGFLSINIEIPINNTFELLGKQLAYEKIEFSFSSKDNSEVLIDCDENKVESVFQNLVTNSFHAFQSNGGENKKISIEIVKNIEKKIVDIEYTDNAGGMSKATLEKIFDPFYTTKEVGKGTGLGMSILQKIIEEHSGKVSVESIEGEGTTILLSFPLSKIIEERRTGAISNLKISQFPKIESLDKRVLFVDDEEDICDIYSSILSEAFLVDSFSDPLKAKKALETTKYDVLITDVKMPKLGGLDLAAFAVQRNPDLNILFISGHSCAEQVSCFEGAKFMGKPLTSAADFLKLVKSFFASNLKKEA